MTLFRCLSLETPDLLYTAKCPSRSHLQSVGEPLNSRDLKTSDSSNQKKTTFYDAYEINYFAISVHLQRVQIIGRTFLGRNKVDCTTFVDSFQEPSKMGYL